MELGNSNAKAFDPSTFSVTEPTVLDQIHSTFKWKEAINWDRRWSHRKRDVELFKIGGELWMLIMNHDDNTLVVDMVKEEYSPSDVKRMLDEGVSTADICTLSNTTWFAQGQTWGDSVFPSVTWTIDQLKQN